MNQNERYKKIPWIHKVKEFFDGENLSRTRLDHLPEQAKKFLVYQTMLTMSKYFSVIPDYHSDSEMVIDTSSDLKKSLNNTLPTWLSGLCDLSVCQIVNGLLDILNMNTDYKRWPPKSVMEFYSVCKKARPPYYEIKSSSNVKQIEYNKTESRKKTEEIAEKEMTNIFKMLGKDYQKIKIDRIKNISI